MLLRGPSLTNTMDTMMLVFPPTADWGMRAVMALQVRS